MVQPSLYSADGKGAVPVRWAGRRPRAGIALSIPNLITLGRILLVPIVVWAISTPGAMWIAFVLFVAAGVSDAVDGFLAKRFAMTTELGAYLDPLADKALSRSSSWIIMLAASSSPRLVPPWSPASVSAVAKPVAR